MFDFSIHSMAQMLASANHRSFIESLINHKLFCYDKIIFEIYQIMKITDFLKKASDVSKVWGNTYGC